MEFISAAFGIATAAYWLPTPWNIIAIIGIVAALIAQLHLNRRQAM